MQRLFLPLLLALTASRALAAPDETKPLGPDEFSAALGGPTLLTLHLHNATPAQAFAEVSRQIGQPIRINRRAAQDFQGRTVSLDVTRQPFWKAMRQLVQVLPFAWTNTPGKDGFEVYASYTPLELNDAGADLGMARIVGIGAKRQRWVVNTFTNPAKQVTEDGDTLRVVTSVLPDPKVEVLGQTVILDEVSALLDNNAQISPLPRDKNLPSGDADRAWWRLNSDLNFNAQRHEKVFDLRGVLRFSVVTKKEVWHIDDVLNAKETSRDFETSRGPLRLTWYPPTRAANGEYKVRLESKLLNAPDSEQGRAFAIALTWFLANKIQLIGHDGVFLGPQSQGIAGDGGESQVSFGRAFDSENQTAPVPEPVSFSVEVPLETREVALPFELQDLAAPQFPDESRSLF